MSPLARAARALAVADAYCHNIQGFQYGADFVVRDLHLAPGTQEIFRAPYDDAESRLQHSRIHNLYRVRAVVAAIRSPSPAMGEALRRIIKVNTGCVVSATTASLAISEALDALLKEPTDG